ncbi:hypothetical protein COCNU_06G006530 [Cocos nucifera]|uniref:Vps16 C-terminal domain-containing protein n=1 Tax=Cocos nucifera TaxID=13894 RepID=A0A8K0N2W7_COCNU|nr:hypothetical protein COCNU_06G006530 [Cocos nucifera]
MVRFAAVSFRVGLEPRGGEGEGKRGKEREGRGGNEREREMAVGGLARPPLLLPRRWASSQSDTTERGRGEGKRRERKGRKRRGRQWAAEAVGDGAEADVAFLLLKESWDLEKNPMASKGGSPLHGPRIRLIEQAQKLFSETKEHTFESKAAEEHAKLLRLQHELEVSTKQAIFVGSSISDTIRTCIVLGNHRAAMRVRAEFKVSEKRWYWLKAFALATVRDWDALEKFSKEKRPPGGYKPFVEACIDADEKAEALKYIPKLAEPRERSEAFARIGMAKEAADAASQAKDSELFGRLKLTLAQNAAASSIFDTLRDRLSFQGVY